jgi:hypothetical protein
MPAPLFVFVQMDFPWTLGPADGRYLLRARPGGDPERVLVLQTLSEGAVAHSRITLVDPVSLAAEQQARAWLEELEGEQRSAIEEALHLVNRVVHFHRIAAADPYVHEVSATQALAIRAGWGTGEELAAGRYTHASELPSGRQAGARRGLLRRGSRRERQSALVAQERLALLLGAHVPTLAAEELALRARLDLDQSRDALAVRSLQAALDAALSELRSERREELALRIDELDQLRTVIEGQAGGDPENLDAEALAHALGRLEAALRARAAAAARDRRAG